MWEQTERQYKLPECSFVAVVQLLVAHLTLVLPLTISLTQLAQRWRVAGRRCSWHAAGIEEICHSCWWKQTLINLTCLWTMCNYLLDMFPTLWDVAAHHRHVALVHEVSYGHIPASCSAFTGVTALFSFQVLDGDALICFLHYSNCVVRCARTCARTGQCSDSPAATIILQVTVKQEACTSLWCDYSVNIYNSA